MTAIETYPNDSFLFETDAWNDIAMFKAQPQLSFAQQPSIPTSIEPTRSVLTKRKRDDEPKKKRKRRKTSRDFTREEFVSLMHLTQREAAKALDICLSTFKRQFSNLRPKLTWPTPSERQNLVRRKRFEQIIQKNEAQEYIASQQFEFGSSSNLYSCEFFSDVDSLVTEYKKVKGENNVLRRALKKSNQIEANPLMEQHPSIQEIPSAPYGGLIDQYNGDWNTLVGGEASLALLDINMNVVASNSNFNSLIDCENMQTGLNFTELLLDLHQAKTHINWFKSLIMEKRVQTVEWYETLLVNKERKHVRIVLHAQQEYGAWLEIYNVQQFNTQVLIDGQAQALCGTEQPQDVRTMDPCADLVYHMKVFQIIKRAIA